MYNLLHHHHLPSFQIRSIHFSFGWSFWEFFTNVLTSLKGFSFSPSHPSSSSLLSLHLFLPPIFFFYSSPILPKFPPTLYCSFQQVFPYTLGIFTYIIPPPLQSIFTPFHQSPPLSLSLPLAHPFLHFRVNFSWILNISTPIAEKEGINKKHKWCTDDRGGGVKLASVSGNGLI